MTEFDILVAGGASQPSGQKITWPRRSEKKRKKKPVYPARTTNKTMFNRNEIISIKVPLAPARSLSFLIILLLYFSVPLFFFFAFQSRRHEAADEITKPLLLLLLFTSAICIAGQIPTLLYRELRVVRLNGTSRKKIYIEVYASSGLYVDGLNKTEALEKLRH